MIASTMPDYIHGYISLERSDLDNLQNKFAETELARLENIAHLGLIGKLRRLARHDKLEHAYGTYWLCKQCVDNTGGLIHDKEAFRLSGLLHGIGHLPFSYDTERAVPKLYQIHRPTHEWVDGVIQDCVEFANNPSVEKAATEMRSSLDYFTLHLWFSALKLAQSQCNEFNNERGKRIVRILLDSTTIEHQLLCELDKMDYVLRDMLYLALGRIDLNVSPLFWSQFSKNPEGQLNRPDLLKLIDTTHDWLCDQVYLGSEERCLAQVLEKSLVKEIIAGYCTVEKLLKMMNKEFEDMLAHFCSCEIALDDVIERIRNGKIQQVARFVCDSKDKSIFTIEAHLVRTNTAGMDKYHQEKGIYVQCTPNPFYEEKDAYEWIDSGVSVSITYDFESARPKHVIGALLQAEHWAPDNPYGAEPPFREEALCFLFGKQVQPRFDRYAIDDIHELIIKHMPELDWKPDLFHESWELRAEAAETLFYEYEFDWPAKHFLHFPEHWSTKIIAEVLAEVERKRSIMRKRKNESREVYKERAGRLLEYFTYLSTVLCIREQNVSGWVLPSVNILKEDGTVYTEVDVVAIHVPEPHKGPVKVELLAVSQNTSPDNKDKNRRKLNKVVQLVKNRFGRKVLVEGSFNNEQVLYWPSAS